MPETSYGPSSLRIMKMAVGLEEDGPPSLTDLAEYLVQGLSSLLAILVARSILQLMLHAM